MRFPYTIFPAKPDAAFPNRQSFRRPILGVILRKNGKSISTLALVDSGADTCVFPASLATQLGITIPNQNVSVFSGTSDAPQLAYYEMVEANIWNGDPKCPPMTFEMRVGFCETLEHVGLGLLGQEGFLSKFPVTFNYSANFFEIG